MHRYSIFFALLIAISSCSYKAENETKSNLDTQNLIYFKGEFVTIKRIADHAYHVYLKDKEGNLIEFYSSMYLGETEIFYLKKDTTNIELAYSVYTDTANKKQIKLIKFLKPIYNSEKLKSTQTAQP